MATIGAGDQSVVSRLERWEGGVRRAEMSAGCRVTAVRRYALVDRAEEDAPSLEGNSSSK